MPALGQAAGRRKRIAFLGTEVRTHSHSQHFLDRLALGYGWRGGWQKPRTDIASVYIDQFPEKGDLGRDRVKRYGLKLYPSIEQALTYAELTKCARLHVMAGLASGGAREDVFVPNLRWAADAAASVGVTVCVEALNPTDFPGYLVGDTATAARLVAVACTAPRRAPSTTPRLSEKQRASTRQFRKSW